jgi:hypothetical protein
MICTIGIVLIYFFIATLLIYLLLKSEMNTTAINERNRTYGIEEHKEKMKKEGKNPNCWWRYQIEQGRAETRRKGSCDHRTACIQLGRVTCSACGKSLTKEEAPDAWRHAEPG